MSTYSIRDKNGGKTSPPLTSSLFTSVNGFQCVGHTLSRAYVWVTRFGLDPGSHGSRSRSHSSYKNRCLGKLGGTLMCLVFRRFPLLDGVGSVRPSPSVVTPIKPLRCALWCFEGWTGQNEGRQESLFRRGEVLFFHKEGCVTETVTTTLSLVIRIVCER